MTQTTMGQRIATQRKLKGLSQEALAEQLEISRQAISKWESDAAIPEIDKLIALARIFGVSVGWLLGTEEEMISDDMFSETQIQIVEKIVADSQPKRRRWLVPVLTAGISALAAFLIYSQIQMNALSTENAAAREQITELSQINQQIQLQMDHMSSVLQAQAEANNLLNYYGAVGILSDDAKSVELRIYLKPKVYQENCKAYLSVSNPYAGVEQMLECSWDGDRYVLRTSLPLAEDYRYSFLLMNEAGYKEQVLWRDVTYFTNLYSSTRYHIFSTESKYLQLLNDEAAPLAVNETTYRYNVPIHAPYFSQIEKGYVGYEDVIFRLRLNGESIWEESCKDRIREHGGVYMNDFATPFMPQIEVALPELAVGDILELEITAITHTGIELTTKLDKLEVVEEMENSGH